MGEVEAQGEGPHLLHDRSRWVSRVRRAMSLGTGPKREFHAMQRLRQSGKSPTAGGTVPTQPNPARRAL